MKNKKINLASLKKSLQLFLLFLIVFSSPLFAQIGHWEELNPPVSPSARQQHGMATLGDKISLLFGGYGFTKNGCCVFLGDTWLFDYKTKEWSELKPKVSPQQRYNHRMCQLSDNIVLLFGGSNDDNGYFDDTWIFNLTDTTWTKLEPKNHPEARSHFGLTQINENNALLFGGRNYNIDPKRDTWLFNYETKEWKKVLFDIAKTPIPYYRIGPVIAQIEVGKIILFGGYSESVGGDYLKDTWLFEIDSMKWKEMNPVGMTDSLVSSGYCNLFKGNIIVFAGKNHHLTDNTWLFDLKGISWKLINVDKIPPARMYPGMTKLEDGIALLFGGFTDANPIGDTWIFTSDFNGVEEKINISNAFQILPNPASDFIEITKPSEGWEPSEGSIRIFNVFGEAVSTSVCSADTSAGGGQRIDVSGLPSGVYFVRVSDKVAKFVKI